MALHCLRAALATVAIGASTIGAPLAQTVAPAFEVASIRPTAYPNLPFRDQKVYPDRFVAVHISASELIQFAYDVPKLQIAGGPAWINQGRFDINAKASGSVTEATIRLMLQSLLRDRFQLGLRTEQRQMRVYELVVDRNDGRLGQGMVRVAGDETCEALYERLESSPRGSLLTADCGLHAFVKNAQAMLNDGIVVDKTRLAGTWFLRVYFAPSTSADSSLPSFFTAIREQLGLRIQPGRGPVDILVIDRINVPSDN